MPNNLKLLSDRLPKANYKETSTIKKNIKSQSALGRPNDDRIKAASIKASESSNTSDQIRQPKRRKSDLYKHVESKISTRRPVVLTD